MFLYAVTHAGSALLQDATMLATPQAFVRDPRCAVALC